MARKSISELKDTPEWLSLNPKQRKFVELYITNGYDAKTAYFEAYDCKDLHTAHCASYAQLQRPKIAMFLHLHFNGTPEQAFIRVIWNMILRKKLTPDQVEIMKLYAPFVRQGLMVREEEEKPAPKPVKDSKPAAPSIRLEDFD